MLTNFLSKRSESIFDAKLRQNFQLKGVSFSAFVFCHILNIMVWLIHSYGIIVTSLHSKVRLQTNFWEYPRENFNWWVASTIHSSVEWLADELQRSPFVCSSRHLTNKQPLNGIFAKRLCVRSWLSAAYKTRTSTANGAMFTLDETRFTQHVGYINNKTVVKILNVNGLAKLWGTIKLITPPLIRRAP